MEEEQSFMKGAILAGGMGSRLYPLTYATNKHLLPVFDKPMIFYPIQTLVNAGVTEVIVVTGGPHAGHFIRVLKNGKELGLDHIEYAYQENSGGIAAALQLCEDFADGGPLTVILGDNTTNADISRYIQSFERGAHIFFKRVPDPERFGVPVLEGDRIVAIEEKPAAPKSQYAVTGLYIYDQQVFDFIHQTKPSGRGELEITDVNNQYVQAGEMRWSELDGFWSDAGTFESLYWTNTYWATQAGAQAHKS